MMIFLGILSGGNVLFLRRQKSLIWIVTTPARLDVSLFRGVLCRVFSQSSAYLGRLSNVLHVHSSLSNCLPSKYFRCLASMGSYQDMMADDFSAVGTGITRCFCVRVRWKTGYVGGPGVAY